MSENKIESSSGSVSLAPISSRDLGGAPLELAKRIHDLFPRANEAQRTTLRSDAAALKLKVSRSLNVPSARKIKAIQADCKEKGIESSIAQSKREDYRQKLKSSREELIQAEIELNDARSDLDQLKARSGSQLSELKSRLGVAKEEYKKAKKEACTGCIESKARLIQAKRERDSLIHQRNQYQRATDRVSKAEGTFITSQKNLYSAQNNLAFAEKKCDFIQTSFNEALKKKSDLDQLNPLLNLPDDTEEGAGVDAFEMESIQKAVDVCLQEKKGLQSKLHSLLDRIIYAIKKIGLGSNAQAALLQEANTLRDQLTNGVPVSSKKLRGLAKSLRRFPNAVLHNQADQLLEIAHQQDVLEAKSKLLADIKFSGNEIAALRSQSDFKAIPRIRELLKNLDDKISHLGALKRGTNPGLNEAIEEATRVVLDARMALQKVLSDSKAEHMERYAVQETLAQLFGDSEGQIARGLFYLENGRIPSARAQERDLKRHLKAYIDGKQRRVPSDGFAKRLRILESLSNQLKINAFMFPSEVQRLTQKKEAKLGALQSQIDAAKNFEKTHASIESNEKELQEKIHLKEKVKQPQLNEETRSLAVFLTQRSARIKDLKEERERLLSEIASYNRSLSTAQKTLKSLENLGEDHLRISITDSRRAFNAEVDRFPSFVSVSARVNEVERELVTQKGALQEESLGRQKNLEKLSIEVGALDIEIEGHEKKRIQLQELLERTRRSSLVDIPVLSADIRFLQKEIIALEAISDSFLIDRSFSS